MSQNLDQQIQISMNLFIMNSFNEKILKTFIKNKKVFSVEIEINERIEFLKELIKLEKILRLFVTIILKTVRVMLKKIHTDWSKVENECNFI